MPEFQVVQSATIDAPIARVFGKLRDFRSWRGWSPWLIAEPECKLTYADDGTGYGWDGNIVGAGEMEVTHEESPNTIDCRLTFLRPWKSDNVTGFRLVEAAGGTQVTWTMTGTLPWFMFWMKGMMTAFVGMDYARGLAMLKDELETGSVPSSLEFTAGVSFPGCRYIGIRDECAMADMGPAMGRALQKLHAWVAETGAETTGRPMSIYHKWKPVKGEAGFTVAIPLASPPADAPAGFVVGEVPAQTSYATKHTGAYRHIGNAWSSAMMHARAKVFTHDKKVTPFEIYENDPEGTPEDQLVTVVHLAQK